SNRALSPSKPLTFWPRMTAEEQHSLLDGATVGAIAGAYRQCRKALEATLAATLANSIRHDGLMCGRSSLTRAPLVFHTGQGLCMNQSRSAIHCRNGDLELRRVNHG